MNTKTPSAARRRVASLLGAAFVLCFAYFAWSHYRSFDWGRFRVILSLLDSRWLFAGILLALSSFVVRAIRWQYLMRPATHSFRGLVEATFVGFSAGVVLGRAGELVRPYMVARDAGVPFASQAAVWLLERLYDLLMIILLFSIGLSVAHRLELGLGEQLRQVLRWGGWFVFFAGLIAAGTLWSLGRHRHLVQRRVGELALALPEKLRWRLESGLDSFFEGCQSTRDLRSALSAFLLTIVEWAFILLSVWAYFQAIPSSGVHSLGETAAYVGFVSFGNIIQLPGIGGGVQMASMVVLTELFKIPLELATTASLAIWAGSSLVVLPFGVPIAIARGVNLFSAKEIEGEGAANSPTRNEIAS